MLVQKEKQKEGKGKGREECHQHERCERLREDHERSGNVFIPCFFLFYQKFKNRQFIRLCQINIEINDIWTLVIVLEMPLQSFQS